MHKSCIHIQNSIYLAPYEIRTCCQRFFVDGKMKGDVSLIVCQDQKDISYADVIQAKQALVTGINNGTDDRCNGCFLLKEQDWDDVADDQINAISIENHSLCNMKCSYCSEVYYGGVEPQYSLEYLFEGLDNVGDNLHIAWGGGEPTARKDFEDLFLLLNKKFHPRTQRIFTNALKYSPVVKTALDERISSITTSIDAGTEETFNLVRGSKGLHKVLQSLERYSQVSPDLITIKYIFTQENFDHHNLQKFVEQVNAFNLTKCNYLISADFKYKALNDHIVFSIISLYFMLNAEGINAVNFDDHIFHKVREIGLDVDTYIDNLPQVDSQVQAVKNIINSFKNRENNVIIWGTGEFSKYLLGTAKNKNLVVSGVVDGMEDKWGSEFMGFEVKPPEFLIDDESDIIIASVNFYGEVFNRIMSLGISKDRVIPNFLL